MERTQNGVPLRWWLQGEALVIGGAGLWIYGQMDAGWGLFALCILLPDLAMLGYVFGPGVGAVAYNIGHSYAAPILLAAVGLAVGSAVAPALAVIWGVHIALDRAIGYGLKDASGFKVTHLSSV